MNTENFIKVKKNIHNSLIIFQDMTCDELRSVLFDYQWDGIPCPTIEISILGVTPKIISSLDSSEIIILYGFDNIFGGDKHRIRKNNKSNYINKSFLAISPMPKPIYEKDSYSISELIDELLREKSILSSKYTYRGDDKLLNCLLDGSICTPNDFYEKACSSELFLSCVLSKIDLHIIMPLMRKKVPKLSKSNEIIKLIGKVKDVASNVLKLEVKDFVNSETTSHIKEIYLCKNNNIDYYVDEYKDIIYLKKEINNLIDSNNFNEVINVLNGDSFEIDFDKFKQLVLGKINTSVLEREINYWSDKVFGMRYLDSPSKKTGYSIENISRNAYKTHKEAVKDRVFSVDGLISALSDDNKIFNESDFIFTKIELYSSLFEYYNDKNVGKKYIELKIRELVLSFGAGFKNEYELRAYFEAFGFKSTMVKEKLFLIQSLSIKLSNMLKNICYAKPILPFYFEKKNYMENHEVIKGIVVPDDLPESILNKLKSISIKLEVYSKGNYRSKIEKIKKINSLSDGR